MHISIADQVSPAQKFTDYQLTFLGFLYYDCDYLKKIGRMKDYLLSIYEGRFDESLSKRNAMWKVLCKDYFQRFIKHDATVLDLAAGYCEFINNIKCRTKIAVDLNPKTKKMANKDVTVYKALSTDMP
ncbi:MAG TPA: hypothetical protein VNZ45_09500, partial [Bacteroidia bacterium]|nr:hypothetical protein [Bacteroidia bacterium]